MSIKKLTDLAGFSGITTDKEFGEITDLLAKFGRVVNEKEKVGLTADLVTTLYKVDTEYYELWYQIYNQYTPKNRNLSFDFFKAKEAPITNL